MSSIASSSSAAGGYRQGVRAAVAVAATVWFFGASFGLVARGAGMGVAAPLVLSATTFAGSAQFALTSILAGSGSAVAAIAAAVLLNARYAPISISVAPLFHGPRLRRLAGFGLYKRVIGHIDRCSPEDLLDDTPPRPVVGEL